MGKIRIIKKDVLDNRQPPPKIEKENSASLENPVLKEKNQTMTTVSAWVAEFKKRRGENPPTFAKLFTMS